MPVPVYHGRHYSHGTVRSLRWPLFKFGGAEIHQLDAFIVKGNKPTSGFTGLKTWLPAVILPPGACAQTLADEMGTWVSTLALSDVMDTPDIAMEEGVKVDDRGVLRFCECNL